VSEILSQQEIELSKRMSWKKKKKKNYLAD